MNETLKDLIRISNTVGADPALVQGTGGNTSGKTRDGKYMYIKASGTSLKNMKPDKGWRRLDTAKVREVLSDRSLLAMDVCPRELEVIKRLLLSCDDGLAGNVRPSVESFLHVLLGKYVIHLHALAVLAYASAKNGETEIFKLFRGEKHPPLWVPYASPGIALFGRVSRLVNKYEKQYSRKPAIMFLQQHGLLVSANEPNAALALVKKTVRRCNAALGQPKVDAVKKAEHKDINAIKRAIKKALFEAGGRNAAVSYSVDRTIAAFLARKDAKQLLRPLALMAEEAGHVNSPIVWLEKWDDKTVAAKVNSAIDKGPRPPVAFLVKDTGLFISSSAKMAPIIKNIVAGSLFVRSNAHDLGGMNPLNKKQREFLAYWEA